MSDRPMVANGKARGDLLARIYARQRSGAGKKQSPLDPAGRSVSLEEIPAIAQESSQNSGAFAGPRPGNLAGEMAGSPALKARFIRFALAGASTLAEVGGLPEVPTAVAAYLTGLGLPRQAAVWSTLGGLDWSSAGVEVAVRAANGDDAVGITGVFCALAETGTLLVLSGAGTASTTSLLPETHIAVVPVSRIVAGMEEAFALVLAERGELPRALNFISGPSRTGDIEQTIVLGAHGPSRVHLVLVNDLA